MPLRRASSEPAGAAGRRRRCPPASSSAPCTHCCRHCASPGSFPPWSTFLPPSSPWQCWVTWAWPPRWRPTACSLRCVGFVGQEGGGASSIQSFHSAWRLTLAVAAGIAPQPRSEAGRTSGGGSGAAARPRPPCHGALGAAALRRRPAPVPPAPCPRAGLFGPPAGQRGGAHQRQDQPGKGGCRGK